GVVIGCIVGIGGSIALGIALAIALGVAGGVIFLMNNSIGIILGVALGISLGIALGSRWKIIWALLLGIVWAIVGYFLSREPIAAALFGVTSALSYMVGYYRLPLYLISGPSGLRMYIRSTKRPQDVFTYLRKSALHWDECIYLPLPGLKHTLSLAAEQSLEKTLDEIAFIQAERPQQISRVLTLSLEDAMIHTVKALHDLPAIACYSP